MYNRSKSGKGSRQGSGKQSNKVEARLYSKNKEKKFRTMNEELSQLRNQKALIRNF